MGWISLICAQVHLVCTCVLARRSVPQTN
ncbi:unnamed protein product [Tetraodon nigroviridis]|uniref:(spotted green pufferfish) hypothetical protein n=1 Tax=Tetraodon nigroviridis TaxID=99883 RepID=Q4STQ9_TETNG|nr:unnamed protein product [Tetraodon nigroviridis]